MAIAKETKHWDRLAEIWVILINSHRDIDKHPEPFGQWDIHPYRTEADYKQEQPQVGDLRGLRAYFGERHVT